MSTVKTTASAKRKQLDGVACGKARTVIPALPPVSPWLRYVDRVRRLVKNS